MICSSRIQPTFDRIFIGIIGSLERQNRVAEQSQRLGCFYAGVYMALLFVVVDLREHRPVPPHYNRKPVAGG
ncbi:MULTISPECIES: hypothetical protein [Sinorhizobium/Ensifer group]|uniref:Uncharacterized protein n=4 Tax=Sinorhizobium TaxID=28105 RepID=I3XGL1_SINF2|nr:MULTISPECIES: hypothetical protein [Sinorhizobium]MCK3780934.1 hypothetical protein [Ensifer sesbaniae]AFL55017.1 hypothetical protein USDA257_p03020 [Sinorhizobium fredii USDA 257]ASY67357.1 hypothetical protein SJ05684_a40440 [Sinorhizobium sojae CCBAU 05684]AWI62064.1 hypothetical protein AB395_00004540 [Sinorhizobium fredii CCBAU 45436]MQW95349.1 hypothetical protein [Sinorhizobium fredii]